MKYSNKKKSVLLNKLLGLILSFVLCQVGMAQNFNKAIEGNPDILGTFTLCKVGNDTFLISAANILGSDLGLASILINDFGDTLSTSTYNKVGSQIYMGWASSSFSTNNNSVLVGGGIADSVDYAHLMKFDKRGDTLWTRTFGDTMNFYTFRQAIEDKDKNILAIGITNKNGSSDGLLIKTDSIGNKLWERTFNKTSMYSESLTSIEATDDGGYILGGWRQDRQRASPTAPLYVNVDPMIIKVDSNGVEEWTYIYDTPFNEANAYVIQTMDGNYVFGSSISVSQSNNVSNGNGRAALFKVDTAGNLMWTKTYGFVSGNHAFQRIMELPDSSLIGVGRRGMTTRSNIMGLMVKADKHGDSLWVNTYEFDPSGINNQNYLWDLVQLDDGGFIAVGQVLGVPPAASFRQDVWVIRVDSNGCILQNCTVSLDDLQSVQTGPIFYPNPSNGPININSKIGIEELWVYDQLGREMQYFQDLKTQFQWKLPEEKGLYLIRWQGEDGSSGVEKVIRE